MRLLLCALVFLLPALLALADLGQRIHAARATLIGSWTGISAERRLKLVFGADGSVQLSSADAPAIQDWNGRWSICPMPFSESPELLIYQIRDDFVWWYQYESGTQELFLRGDSTVLLRRHSSALSVALMSTSRSIRIDCGKSEPQWQLQLDTDQRGQLQRLRADGSPLGNPQSAFWLDMPDGWQPGVHVLIGRSAFESTAVTADSTPVQLRLAADQTISLDYSNHVERSCEWRE